MTVTELGNKLRKMYETEGANKTSMIHLFGVMYADEMYSKNIIPVEVVKAAQIPESYKTEVNKGMNLSRYVAIKPEYKNKF